MKAPVIKRKIVNMVRLNDANAVSNSKIKAPQLDKIKAFRRPMISPRCPKTNAPMSSPSNEIVDIKLDRKEFSHTRFHLVTTVSVKNFKTNYYQFLELKKKHDIL